ncbi:MAG: Delta-60 repeat protein/Por secretion system C-terminal sorting [Hymenobacter sp.]|nr:Delta-60 repeat protein/Por secretion system C-terminal sorting [Hymenobacter sp.]
MLKHFYALSSVICGALLLASAPAIAQSVLDPTFTPTTLKLAQQSGNYAVRAMLQQPDGKILTGGSYDFVDNQRVSRMRRLNADGTPDVAFATQTGTGTDGGSVVALALQSTGKILVGCAFSRTYNGVLTGNLVRLNATGSVDAAFNAGGTGFTYNEQVSSSAPNFGNNIRSLTVQTDDKILVGGNLDRYNGQDAANLVRLNANGTLDTSFSVGALGLTATGALTSPSSGTPETILVQPDGKIVVGGTFAQVNGVPAGNLVRLNANGTIDNTFLSTGTNGTVRTVARQPDGKLLVGGLFTQVNGQAGGGLVRLNADGTRDVSFTPGVLSPTGNTTGIYNVRLNADGTIVACGTFTAYNGTARGGVARVSATGVLDTSFGPATATTAPTAPNIIYNLLELTNGQLLVGGTFTSFAGATRTGLARLNASASQVDAAYNSVIEFGGSLSSVMPLNNGDLLVGVYASSINGTAVATTSTLHRLNSSGGYVGRVVLNLAPYSFMSSNPRAMPDGRFMVSGYNSGPFGSTDCTLLRLLANGTLDTSFTPLAFTYPPFANSGYSPAITPLPNGDLLLTGDFTAVNGQPRPGLARVTATGALDQAFNLPGAPWQAAAGGNIYYLAGVQPNGQPIVHWYDNNGTYLTRLSATTGAVDNTFSIGSGGGPNTFFYASLQPNGQVVINGSFTSFNGQATPNGMLRLLANGQPDTSFAAAAALYIVAIQPDGRLIGAQQPPATEYFPEPVVRLRRLNTDGSLDSTFPTIETPQGIFYGTLIGTVMQPQDGKLLIYGVTSVNGQLCGSLVRISNTLLATRPAFAAAPELEVFPNPAQQQVTLRVPATAVSATAQPVLLLDMQGRTVRRFALPAHQSEAVISLAEVAAGVYLLQTTTGQGPARQRVTVVH